MNFRGRCHPDMLHSEHQQINKKAKEKKNGQNTFSKMQTFLYNILGLNLENCIPQLQVVTASFKDGSKLI